MRHFAAVILGLAGLAQAAFDITQVPVGSWYKVRDPAEGFSYNGANWNYENDWVGDPFFGLFVLGPGHRVHPQDSYFYIYDPVKDKWMQSNTATRPGRRCLSKVGASSQDTIILQMGGTTGHQNSQGAFNSTYDKVEDKLWISYDAWVYSFNRNHFFHMKAPGQRAPHVSIFLPRIDYDPVHDIFICAGGNSNTSTWAYNFHYNQFVQLSAGQTPDNNERFGAAVDTRRGLYYIHGGANVSGTWVLDPETSLWSQVTTSTVPPKDAYYFSSMDYDARHDIILYQSESSPYVQTWVFDGATRQWSGVSPAVSPVDPGTFAFSEPLNLFMIFGGQTFDATTIGRHHVGQWAYRYAAGPTAYDSLAAAPDAAINLSGSAPQLSWTAVSEPGVTGYNIHRGSGPNYPKGFTKVNSSPVSGTSYTDNTAAAGVRYSYRVAAIKGGVEGKRSRHLYTTPGRVMGVAASVESAAQVIVSWNRNPETGLTGYNVYRARGAQMYNTQFLYTKLNTSPVTDSFFNDNAVDLSDGVARGYVVTAVNGLGSESGYSPTATTFPPCPLWARTIPTRVGTQNVTLARWQPPERVKIAGVNLYMGQHHDIVNPTPVNGTTLITDTSTTWPLPTTSVGEAATMVMAAVNVLGQEGFVSDQISPTNTDFTVGLTPSYLAFNPGDYTGKTLAVEGSGRARAAAGLSVHPNPARGRTVVRAPGHAGKSLQIMVHDLNGRQVDRFSTGKAEQIRWNASALPAGLYLLTLKAGGRAYTQKVVVAR